MKPLRSRLQAWLIDFGGSQLVAVLSLVCMGLGVVKSLSKLSSRILEPFGWRSADTARMVEDFYAYGFAITKPDVGWLGQFRYQAFEFPLAYAPAVGLYHLIGPYPVLGKAYLFLFYPVGCLYFYKLARAYVGAAWAALSLGCYAIFPLTVFYSISYQIDFLVQAAVLGVGWHGLCYLRQGRPIHAWAFGGWFFLAVTEKAPYLLLMAPLLAWEAWRQFDLKRNSWLSLAALPGILVFYAWLKWSAYLESLKPHSIVLPSIVIHPDWATWYYGHLADRFTSSKWLWMATHLMHGFSWVGMVLGLVGLVWLFLLPHRFAWLLVAGYALLAVSIYNLLWIHDYYHIPGAVAAALLAAFTLLQLLRANRALGLVIYAIFVGNCLVTANTDYFMVDDDLEEIGAYTEAHTRPGDAVLFINPTAAFRDPHLPYFSHRYGLNLRPEQVNSLILTESRRFGVNTVVAINSFGFVLPEIPADSIQMHTAKRNHQVVLYRLKPEAHPVPPYRARLD